MARETQAETPVEGAIAAKPASKKLRMVVALTAIAVLSSAAGGYFVLKTIAATPGGAETADFRPALPAGPLPVATIVAASPVRAQDYQVVSVFNGEAILATRDNLIRVRVGSVAQGLGTITSVEAFDDGRGKVIGTEATLRTL